MQIANTTTNCCRTVHSTTGEIALV